MTLMMIILAYMMLECVATGEEGQEISPPGTPPVSDYTYFALLTLFVAIIMWVFFKLLSMSNSRGSQVHTQRLSKFQQNCYLTDRSGSSYINTPEHQLINDDKHSDNATAATTTQSSSVHHIQRDNQELNNQNNSSVSTAFNQSSINSNLTKIGRTLNASLNDDFNEEGDVNIDSLLEENDCDSANDWRLSFICRANESITDVHERFGARSRVKPGQDSVRRGVAGVGAEVETGEVLKSNFSPVESNVLSATRDSRAHVTRDDQDNCNESCNLSSVIEINHFNGDGFNKHLQRSELSTYPESNDLSNQIIAGELKSNEDQRTEEGAGCYNGLDIHENFFQKEQGDLLDHDREVKNASVVLRERQAGPEQVEQIVSLRRNLRNKLEKSGTLLGSDITPDWSPVSGLSDESELGQDLEKSVAKVRTDEELERELDKCIADLYSDQDLESKTETPVAGLRHCKGLDDDIEKTKAYLLDDEKFMSSLGMSEPGQREDDSVKQVLEDFVTFSHSDEGLEPMSGTSLGRSSDDEALGQKSKAPAESWTTKNVVPVVEHREQRTCVKRSKSVIGSDGELVGETVQDNEKPVRGTDTMIIREDLREQVREYISDKIISESLQRINDEYNQAKQRNQAQQQINTVLNSAPGIHDTCRSEVNQVVQELDQNNLMELNDNQVTRELAQQDFITLRRPRDRGRASKNDDVGQDKVSVGNRKAFVVETLSYIQNERNSMNDAEKPRPNVSRNDCENIWRQINSERSGIAGSHDNSIEYSEESDQEYPGTLEFIKQTSQTLSETPSEKSSELISKQPSELLSENLSEKRSYQQSQKESGIFSQNQSEHDSSQDNRRLEFEMEARKQNKPDLENSSEVRWTEEQEVEASENDDARKRVKAFLRTASSEDKEFDGLLQYNATYLFRHGIDFLRAGQCSHDEVEVQPQVMPSKSCTENCIDCIANRCLHHTDQSHDSFNEYVNVSLSTIGRLSDQYGQRDSYADISLDEEFNDDERISPIGSRGSGGSGGFSPQRMGGRSSTGSRGGDNVTWVPLASSPYKERWNSMNNSASSLSADTSEAEVVAEHIGNVEETKAWLEHLSAQMIDSSQTSNRSMEAESEIIPNTVSSLRRQWQERLEQNEAE